jgi:hypothetical protein
VEDVSSGMKSGQGSEMDSNEEPQSEEEAVACDMYGQVPCDWDTFGEEIWEECHVMKEQGMDNKTVRYHAYRMYTRLRHGILCHFDHQPLPVCMRGEIMDEWPDPNHVYVWFQAAIRDAAMDS